MTGMKNPTLVTVPQGGTMLDVLAERYRAAFDKMQAGREQWIEGTLELAAVVAEARLQLPDHRGFSQWLQRYNLGYLSPNDRQALIGFNRDPKAARKMLEKSCGASWRYIWEIRPRNARNGPLSEYDKGPQRVISRQSGSFKRKRAARIPDVMRNETPVTPPASRKQLSEIFLTPEQVDPDFKGTPLEFTTKYGHVLLHTKDQIDQNKRQEALMAWLGTVADCERAGRTMLAALAKLDPATLAEWASKPAKAEKLRAWCDSIQVACEAISKLRPASG